MAFDVSALTNYTDEQSKELLFKAQFKGKLAQYATKHTKVKSSKNLHKISGGIFLQAGGTCDFNASGDTAFTDTTLTTYPFKVEEEYCFHELEDKWTQILLNAGQQYSESDMPLAMREMKVNEIAQVLSIADWLGDITSGNPNLNRYDGLVKKITDSGSAVEANNTTYYGTAATAIDQSTVINAIRAMVKAFAATAPALAGKATVKIFVNRTIFNHLVFAYLEKNYFSFNGTADQGVNELPLLGTNYKVIVDDGLNTGAEQMYMFDTDQLHLGVDGDNEDEDVVYWIDPSNRKTVRMRAEARRGWAMTFYDQVITFTV